jgi:probable HAF family extracellular repeat protein
MKRLYIVCLITLTLVSPVVVTALPKYSVTIVPLIPTAINNKGHVAGDGLLWNKKLINLDPKKSFPWANTRESSHSITAINKTDQIVGYCWTSGAVTSYHPFSWSKGKMIAIDGNYGHRGSTVADINNTGKIVGNIDGQNTEDMGPDAAYWRNGRAKAFNLGKHYKWRHSTADAINNNGDIAGVWTDEKDMMHSFLICKDKLVNMGSIGAKFCFYYVTGINDSCQIVGYARTRENRAGQSTNHAFLWSKGRLHDLGYMDGHSTFATGINSQGYVVGYSQEKNRDIAFIWINGKYYDLNTLLTKAVKPKMVRATGINDRGEIIGYCEEKNKIVGVLLKPVK